jgi:signal transduction histidine kinase
VKRLAQVSWWRDRVSAAVLTLCLADLVLIALTLWALFDYRSTIAERGEARKAVIALDASLLAMVDAETGQRGYLITADPEFLEPYHSGVTRLDSALASLSSLVPGTGPQRARFDELTRVVAATEAGLARELSLSGDVSAVQRAVRDGDGKALMDDVRARLGVMRAEAAATAAAKERHDRYLGNVLAISAIAVAALTLVMVVGLTLSLRRRVEVLSLRHANVAKDEFVGFISHELRGPIAIIAGNAHLLEEAHPEGPAQAAISEITSNASRLDATVATLMSLARAEGGRAIEVEPVLVHRIAEAAARLHRTRFPGREVHLSYAAPMPPAMANRSAVEQVLLNLLQNAEKYGHPSSPIRVEVSFDISAVTVSILNDGERVAQRNFDQVFEPFFQAASSAVPGKGVGLGLTVCHRLITAQGGAIHARALPAGGAKFSFTLPAADLSDDAEPQSQGAVPGVPA